MMQYRSLGKTGLQISVVGLETQPFGMPFSLSGNGGKSSRLSELESINILHRGLIEGINFLETARHYGESETIIGRALKRHPDDLYVATQLAPLSDQMTDEEMAKAIKASIEASRRTLDRETIEVMQLSNATETLLQREVIPDILSLAKHREWIRFQGIVSNTLPVLEKAIEQGYWETLQIEFAPVNPQIHPIVEEAHTKGIGLIVRTPPPPSATEFALLALQDVVKRTKLSSLQTLALFALSYPQISTVLCQSTDITALLESVETVHLPPLTTEQINEVLSASRLH